MTTYKQYTEEEFTALAKTSVVVEKQATYSFHDDDESVNANEESVILLWLRIDVQEGLLKAVVSSQRINEMPLTEGFNPTPQHKDPGANKKGSQLFSKE